MDLRPLGHTGLHIAPIGLGTVKLGRDSGLKLAAPPRIPNDDEALTLLRTARDLGVNLIDTAPAYGHSEERLGQLLPQVGQRDAWVIFTKVGEVFDTQTATSRYDFTPAAIRASVRQSLTRLRTDYLDGVLLHFSSHGDLDAATLRSGEALATLRQLQHVGLVRAVGASTGSEAGGLLAAVSCDVVMVAHSALDQSHRIVIDAARAAGCGVILKKALAGGRSGPESLPGLLATPGVTTAVIGTTSPANLRAAAAGF